MKNNIPMTIHGENELKKELKYLKNIKRNEIIKEISEARSHGDLKENSEYQYAREKQLLCENRIKDIEDKLSNAIIIDVSKINNNDRVIFGSTIIIKDIINNIIKSYCIVGEEESNIEKNKISIYSPISRGFIGKKVGDIVVIDTPNGIFKYELLEIKLI